MVGDKVININVNRIFQIMHVREIDKWLVGTGYFATKLILTTRKMRGKFLGFYHPITYVHIHHNTKYIARYMLFKDLKIF